METLVVTCMDRRLNRYLDSLNDGKTIFLRNAGGNVGSLTRSIRHVLSSNHITRIHVIVHTDCGAMKVVEGARLNNGKVSDRVHKGLVSHFEVVNFKNRTELEQQNQKLQRDAADILAGGGVTVTSQLVDITKLAQHEAPGEHVLAVTRASGAMYENIAAISGSDVREMYTVQADNLDEVVHDIEIATGALGIHTVRIVALNDPDYTRLLADLKRLGSKLFVDCIKA